MNDDLRDEYPFDYRRAKPNCFAAAVKSGGLVLPTPTTAEATVEGVPVSRVGIHPELSDEQKHLLEDLYARNPLPVDDLPYSDEMEQLHRDFVREAGSSVTIREVYRALKTLGRQGRLGGKALASPATPPE